MASISLRDPSDADKAYAAGFFDGEGCVFIQRRTDRRGHILWVFATQSYPGPLLWLQDRWGGSVRPRKQKGVPSSWKPCHEWYVFGSKALRFLRDVVPHLLVKAPQVWLAMEFLQIPLRGQIPDERRRRQIRKDEISIAMRGLNGRFNNRRNAEVN